MTSSNGRGLTISGPGAHNVGSSGTAETGRVQSLPTLSITPLAKWTGDDSEFAARVARSAQRLGANESASFRMFVACAAQWGPRSAPALGCLLAMVREAWGDPSAVTSPDGVTWGVHVASAPVELTVPGWDTMVAMEDTEAEALGAALDVAP